jgi:CRISPR-associated protein Csd1
MTILQGLVRYYERLENTGALAPDGFSTERIAFAIVLTPDGGVVDVDDLRDHSGRKATPRSLVVPKPVKRTSGVAANFLWDKTAYTFGVSATSKRVQREHAAFRTLHEELLRETNDKALVALLAFLEAWRPAQYRNLRYADEMLDQNLVFRLDKQRAFIHEQPAAHRIWRDHLSQAGSNADTCLVTGEQGPIARLHPAIKSVPGAQTSGARLVSFNLDAFTSYGKIQGDNAPISERAAHAYGTALNTLLALKEGVDAKGRPRWKNRCKIGDATTVFWAEATGGPEAAERAEAVFSWTIDPPAPTDEQEAAKVRSILQKIESGRPVEDIDELGGKLRPETRFYVLGLSPNASRLAVRFFLQSTLGEFINRAGQHYRDLSIEPHSSTVPPALWRLLRETAPQRDADNVSPALAGELARAVFTGNRYPRALLALTLMRIRADAEINDLRAAICKACIVRDKRKGCEEEDVPVTLDRNELNAGYRLGRLFAVLESAQYAALGRVNANIRDKYFSSASANPARVFPLLLRGAQDHLGKVRSKGSGGLAHWFDDQIADVMSGLPSARPFPNTLRLEDQGRFAVGYYHQRNVGKTERGDIEELAETESEEN